MAADNIEQLATAAYLVGGLKSVGGRCNAPTRRTWAAAPSRTAATAHAYRHGLVEDAPG